MKAVLLFYENLLLRKARSRHEDPKSGSCLLRLLDTYEIEIAISVDSDLSSPTRKKPHSTKALKSVTGPDEPFAYLGDTKLRTRDLATI